MQVVDSPVASPRFLLQTLGQSSVSTQLLTDQKKASPQFRLSLALCLLLGLFLLEIGIGYWSHSLALIADAGHVFIDVLALSTTLFSTWLARSPNSHCWLPNPERLELQSALLNTVSLLVVATVIAVEAIHRLQLGQTEVLGLPMLGAATAGLSINLINVCFLKSCSHHNLNLKSAFLHVIVDVISSVGVVIGAIAITFWQWSWADDLISLLVAAMIFLFSSPLLLKISQQIFNLPTLKITHSLQKPVIKLQSCLANYCKCSESHSTHNWNSLLSPSLEDLIR